MRIREVRSKHDKMLTIYFLAVISAFFLIIYFLNISLVVQMILELILIPLATSIAIISYFIGENLFVSMYRNFRRKTR